LLAHSFGGKTTYLVDVGEFASQELQPYKDMINFLQLQNLPVPATDEVSSLSEIMNLVDSYYLTSGISSLKSIESNSVDFVLSQAVLEHIRRADFLDIMKEIRRIMRRDGICSHVIDLRDHLDLSLHNLRFTEKIWESNVMANSGFYTNRIQYSQMLDIFQQAGFEVKSTQLEKWDSLPIARSKLAEQFRHLTDEELCISGFSVILQPA
jgi:predicted SAM-dependent methyltransferase